MSRPLTPLALTVLRMLCDGPMHPYEMQQLIRDHHYDTAVKVTHGSLYHSVERLAAAGLIEQVETSRAGRRPERTVYAVTAAGRDAAHMRLAELLARPTDEFPLFGTALAFINLLPEAEVARQLRKRAVGLTALLAGRRTINETLRGRGIERYKLVDQEWSIAQAKAELDFVETLAGDLESGRLTWEDENDGGRRPARPCDTDTGTKTGTGTDTGTGTTA